AENQIDHYWPIVLPWIGPSRRAAGPERRSLSSRLGDELERVLEARVRDGLAAEHPGNLAHPVVLDQDRDRRRRAPLLLALLHAKVQVGVGRDLRQVRIAEDLPGPRDLAEL